MLERIKEKLELIKEKKAYLSALILVLLGATAYYFFSSGSVPMQEIKVVEAEKLTKTNINQTIRLTGKVKARYSTMLIAKVPGILNIIIPAGNKVTKDTVIAKIDSIEVEKQYTLSSSAEIIAREQFERAKKLFKSGAYSKSDFETVQDKWILAQKDLANAKIDFDNLQITAPFDGIIGLYKYTEGTQLKLNDNIVSFYDPTNVILEFDIPASVMPYVDNGQKLIVDGKTYNLNHVQRMLDAEKHMSPASVDISCSNCLIGSNLDLDLTVISKDNVIVIPFSAVFFRDGKSCVYVIKENILELRNVELGMREKEGVEIIEGLEEGETIVSKSTSRLYPGASVRIYGITNATN